MRRRSRTGPRTNFLAFPLIPSSWIFESPCSHSLRTAHSRPRQGKQNPSRNSPNNKGQGNSGSCPLSRSTSAVACRQLFQVDGRLSARRKSRPRRKSTTRRKLTLPPLGVGRRRSSLCSALWTVETQGEPADSRGLGEELSVCCERTSGESVRKCAHIA